jgi:hypothetical protein
MTRLHRLCIAALGAALVALGAPTPAAAWDRYLERDLERA